MGVLYAIRITFSMVALLWIMAWPMPAISGAISRIFSFSNAVRYNAASRKVFVGAPPLVTTVPPTVSRSTSATE